MIRTSLVMALALAGATPAAAQYVSKKQPLTLGQEQSQRAVILFRDSLVAAQASLAALERDYEKASAAALESRATTIAERCAAAARTLPVARQLLVSAELQGPEQDRARRDMLTALDRTKPTLGTCETTYRPLGAPGHGEEVRSYGNLRAKPIKKELTKFEQSVYSFARGMGLEVRDIVRAGPAPVG
jgi:hypothetical protein